MNLWETEKELIRLKKEKEELLHLARCLLYQAEFHADEYKDVYKYDGIPILRGVISRFEGMANDIKKIVSKYPQIKKAG